MFVHGVILFLSLSAFEEGKGGGYLVKSSKIFYSHYFEKFSHFYSNSVLVVVEVKPYNHCFKIFLNQHISSITLNNSPR